MSATAIWFWKEWRAQRGLLGGYLALAFGVLLLARLAFWSSTGLGEPFFVGLCMYAGLLGAIVFAAPQCVRGEVHGRDDQFLRRLPGALRPAFAAKQLFVLLAAVVLPLLGLLVGEVTAAWHGLVGFAALLDRGPALAQAMPLLLAALPWVLAAAIALPGGRMAVGVAALAEGAVVVGYTMTLDAHPGLGKALDSTPHATWLGLLGLVVAVAAWSGRRGGARGRSARRAVATALLGLLPSAVWLASWVVEYRTPLSHIAFLDVIGFSKDHRFVLGTSQRDWNWPGVTWRIDLATGSADVLLADQVRAMRDRDNWAWPGQHDLWLLDQQRQRSSLLLDLVTGTTQPVSWEGPAMCGASREWREQFAAQMRDTTPFRQAGGRPAWIENRRLHLEEPDGSVSVVDLPGAAGTVLQAGHGLVWPTGIKWRAYDFATRHVIDLSSPSRAYAVDSVWLLGPCFRRNDRWSTLDPATGALAACAALTAGDTYLGMLRDGEVLMEQHERGRRSHLFAFAPATGQRREVAWDEPEEWWFGEGDAAGPSVDGWRDPEGRRWITGERKGTGTVIVAVDPATARATTILKNDLLLYVCAIEPDHCVFGVEDRRRIVRIDWATGRKTILFDLQRGTHAVAR
jgi:hypothetical protein